MHAVVLLGGSNQVYKTLGKNLRGHEEELWVLDRVSFRKEAVARLWEMHMACAPLTTKWGWFGQSGIAKALISQRDARGVDILMECLAVKEPWLPDGNAPQAIETNQQAFRLALHINFRYVAWIIDEDFGYKSINLVNGEALPQAILKMRGWWAANRQTWDIEKALSTAVPTIQEGKNLTNRQARILAAKLLSDDLSKQKLKLPDGQVAARLAVEPGYFIDVAQKDGQWTLRLPTSQWEALVSFKLDGREAKIKIGNPR